MTTPITVGMVLFPRLNQLDLTGPYEVFSRMPGAKVRLLAATMEPVRSEWGLTIAPDAAFADAGQVDILCVPGGWGVNEQMENEALLAFLRDQSIRAGYITSVCSGALLLGAAGLLNGYRATTHWMSLDLLALLGAEPVEDRVVVDRNRVTGGGVTAGIDFGLVVVRELAGASAAQEIQLAIEYQPSPPFESGLPSTAPATVRDAVLLAAAQSLDERRRIVERVSGRVVPRKTHGLT
ncbi:MAG: DJ-1/PfpI family protein [bacterium]